MSRGLVVGGILAALAIIGANGTNADTGGGSEGSTPTSQAQKIGKRMAADDYSWTGGEWDCLRQLWINESNWDPNAVNESSGAYGIPQILPSAHGRPVALGDAEGQIAWGLNYIEGRYGTPCEAWSFWQRQSPHWY